MQRPNETHRIKRVYIIHIIHIYSVDPVRVIWSLHLIQW